MSVYSYLVIGLANFLKLFTNLKQKWGNTSKQTKVTQLFNDHLKRLIFMYPIDQSEKSFQKETNSVVILIVLLYHSI